MPVADICENGPGETRTRGLVSSGSPLNVAEMVIRDIDKFQLCHHKQQTQDGWYIDYVCNTDQVFEDPRWDCFSQNSATLTSRTRQGRSRQSTRDCRRC